MSPATTGHQVGDKVYVGKGHVPWEIVRDFGDKVELYSPVTTRKRAGGGQNGTMIVDKSRLTK